MARGKGEEGWWGDLKTETAQLVKRLLESTMDGEVLEHVRGRRYERSDIRRGYRNGYRKRNLLTEFGLLDGVRVPADRQGSYRPVRNRVSKEARGISTRPIQERSRCALPGMGGPMAGGSPKCS